MLILAPVRLRSFGIDCRFGGLYPWRELLAVLHHRPEPFSDYRQRVVSHWRGSRTRPGSGKGRKGCKGRKPQVSLPCAAVQLDSSTAGQHQLSKIQLVGLRRSLVRLFELQQYMGVVLLTCTMATGPTQGLEGCLSEPTGDGSGSPIGHDSYRWQRFLSRIVPPPIAA